MPKTNKHIKIVGLAVFLLCLCAGLFASATQASALSPLKPPAPQPFATGVALLTPDTPVQIASETLNIQFNPPEKQPEFRRIRQSANFQSVYRLTNTANEPAALSTAFITPPIPQEAGQHTVTADGADVVYTVEYYSYMWDYDFDIEKWEEYFTPQSEGLALNLVRFTVHFAPRQTVELKIGYRYVVPGYPVIQNRTHLYYGTTHSQSLMVNLTLDKSQPYLINPSNFTRQQKRVYTHTYAQAPKEIQFTSASWMGRIGVYIPWMYLLSLIILFCAAAYLCWFIIFTIRKKNKLPPSVRIKTSWLVLNCFCSVILFLLSLVLFWRSYVLSYASIIFGGFIFAPIFAAIAVSLCATVIIHACKKTYTKENKKT
ncbi:MAG: hypothetical protein FWH03_09000 [Firmicutes bacterium]|nr:hypothetical protein [Bacillota bacterium]